MARGRPRAPGRLMLEQTGSVTVVMVSVTVRVPSLQGKGRVSVASAFQEALTGCAESGSEARAMRHSRISLILLVGVFGVAGDRVEDVQPV